MRHLEQYLRTVSPEYAILISGKWGVGKSYAWNLFSRRMADFELTPITMSAAGLQTYADLERALFQASVKGIGSETFREASTIVGRALLRFAKIDPDEIELKASITGGKSVVCIDDVERFAGDFLTIFGFAVGVLDGNGAHCVLIADEERAVERFPEYAKYKERIVGKTVRVNPDLHDFCTSVVNGIGHQFSQDVLTRNIEVLVDLLLQKRIFNLRTVRSVVTEVDHIIREMPEGLSVDIPIENLLSAVMFWSVAVSQSTQNESLVAKAFSTSDLGMILALHEARQSTTDSSILDRLEKLLRSLGFYEEAKLWPESPALVALIGGAGWSPIELARDFRIIEPVGTVEEDPLRIVQGFRKASDADVQAGLVALEQEISDRPIQNLSRFFEIYRARYYLSQIGVLDRDPAQVTEQTIQMLGRTSAEEIADWEVEFWMGPYDENESRVVAAIKDVAATRERDADRALKELALAALLDPRERLPDATIKLFDGVDPVNFYCRLVESGRGGAQRLQSFLRGRMRIQNSPDFVGDDTAFCDALSLEIENQTPAARPLTIDAAELREVARAIQAYVAYSRAYLGRRARGHE